MAKVKIEIEDSTWQRLQKNSVPLVDTIDSVLNDALAALESRKRQLKNSSEGTESEISGNSLAEENSKLPELEFNTNNLPDVTHTRVLDVTIDGQRLEKPEWNKILIKLFELANGRGYTAQDMASRFSVPILAGQKIDSGFRFLDNLNMSYRPMQAKLVCKLISKVASILGVNLNIGFEWRAKREAVNPGRKGRIRI